MFHFLNSHNLFVNWILVLMIAGCQGNKQKSFILRQTSSNLQRIISFEDTILSGGASVYKLNVSGKVRALDPIFQLKGELFSEEDSVIYNVDSAGNIKSKFLDLRVDTLDISIDPKVVVYIPNNQGQSISGLVYDKTKRKIIGLIKLDHSNYIVSSYGKQVIWIVGESEMIEQYFDTMTYVVKRIFKPDNLIFK